MKRAREHSTKMAIKLDEKSRPMPNARKREIPLLEQTSEVEDGRRDNQMTKMFLSEAVQTTLMLVEGTGGQSGKKIARGEFGRVDEATANGRRYPRAIIEREIKRLGEDLRSRRVMGELDHPQDGKTSLLRVSHIVTKLWVDGSGKIMGEAEILPTPNGKILEALVESKVQVGVSSRGFGSTKPIDDKGKQVEEVGDDYLLKTFDFVCEPAMKTAYPAIYTEDVDEEQPDPALLFAEAFPEAVRHIREEAAAKTPSDDSLREAIQAEMSEAFEKNVASMIIDMKEEVASQLREKYEHDPNIAGAKTTLIQIAEMLSDYHVSPDESAVRDALKAKDVEISGIESKLSEAVSTAQKATFMLHVERKIGAHHMAESIRKLFKGVEIESIQDADDRLGTILSQLPSAPEVKKEDTEEMTALREEKMRFEVRVAALEERAVDLSERLKEAKLIGEKLDDRRKISEERVRELEKKLEEAVTQRSEAVKLAEEIKSHSELNIYKHNKVAGLTNSRELLVLMEGLSDRTSVDELVAKRGTTMVSDAALEQARKKAGRGHVGSDSELTEEDRRSPGAIVEKDPVFGMIGTSLDEASRLAGS